MSTHYYELADNRCLGLDLFEVYSFPDMRAVSSSEKEACEKISKEFEQLLAEIHKLLGDNTCLEIIWLAEEANNQTFRSYVRVFFVLRKIGSNNRTIGYAIENTKTNIIASLLPLQFGINDSEEKYGELVELLSTVNSESVFSVAKGEQCLGNSNSLYPYYYTDVVPGKSKNGFQSIVTSLSQSKNCCISVQIFPTTVSEEELYMIN